MNEIVVVPTYKREALLFLCLEAIRKQEPDIDLCVSLDKGYWSDDGLIAMREMVDCYWTLPGQQADGYGNSGHVFRALNCACAKDASFDLEPYDIVHYIEDDTIVHPGYFEWARKTLAEGYAAVCGRMPSEHYENWYSAPCASWNADCLRIVLSHVTPEYLAAKTEKEMREIVDEQVFPKSKYYRCYTPQQDGLMCRIIEAHGWRTAFPPKPLATHLGFGGVNRPPGDVWPTGTFEEQVQFFRDLLKDRPRREKLFGAHTTKLEWEALFGCEIAT